MLLYIGEGRWLPGIPARDLTDAEVARFGGEEYLVATGLYKSPTKEKLVGGRENKRTAYEAEVKDG